MEIFKEFTFEAAHFLPHVPESHRCWRMHGHTFTVRIVATGVVGPTGWICDFAAIEHAWEKLAQQLDHRVLNEVPGLDNPTCETLARWIFHRIDFPDVEAVTVMETRTSGCTYRRSDVP